MRHSCGLVSACQDQQSTAWKPRGIAAVTTLQARPGEAREPSLTGKPTFGVGNGAACIIATGAVGVVPINI
jgi:hypothetical protein